jgi:hypothetical protein
VTLPSASQPRILAAAHKYWRDRAASSGALAATGDLLGAFWEFLRDSTPSRLKQRFGDAEYDWDFRVNTTSGAVGWRDRLLGILNSPYQPTDPSLFHEMLAALHQRANLDFSVFTFIDLGSGKGRTLLMAAVYPFRRIIGVELLPSLNRISQENLAQYKSKSQKCFALESICGDAAEFVVPEGPVVIYLFNPLPESGLRRALGNVGESLAANPRPVFVLYHNPQLERVFVDVPVLRKIAGTHQYSIFSAG